MTRAPAASQIEGVGSVAALVAEHVRRCLAGCATADATALLQRLAVEQPRLSAAEVGALAGAEPIELPAGAPRVQLRVLPPWRADTTAGCVHSGPAGIHVLCGRAYVARREDGASAFELVGEGESAVFPPDEVSHCAAARDDIATIALQIADATAAPAPRHVPWSFDPDARADYYWGYEERYEAVYNAGAELWESAEPNDSLVAFAERYPGLGTRVLDLGCGEGRDSLYLARRGFAVTGVDVSRTALDRARGRTANEGLDCTFLERDVIYLRNLGEQPFDWALNMGCLHMLQDDRARAGHLARVRALLAPGGLFLVSHCMRDWGRGFYSVPHYEELGSLRPGMRTQRRIRIGQDEGHLELTELPYRESSADDLCGELSSAGLEIVERLTEDTYAFGSAAVIVARRPASESRT